MSFLTANTTASVLSALPTNVAGIDLNPMDLQSPWGAYLPILMALGFLVYISYTPRIKGKIPSFTPETYPIIGSYRFFTHKLSFWKAAQAASKNGMFSFWLGKNHVVGVSGEAARKMYLEHPGFDHIKGVILIGHGPDYIDGRKTKQHGIWLPVMAGNKSYAQKNVLNCQKTAELNKRLPKVTNDVRKAFESVGKQGGIINPARMCAVLTWDTATRVFGADEIIDVPENRAKLLYYLPILQKTSSCHLLSFPWASYFSVPYWKRKYGREGMRRLITPIVEARMRINDPVRADDPLQTFVDNGDSADYMINFLVSMIFISAANGCVISGAMLYSIAHHPEIQEKIYQEIKSVANQYAADSSAPLVDQLDSLPVKAWENMSQTIDLCYKECIRMWVAFPMGRMNEGTTDIPIPGTDGEVVPAGGLCSYNTIDVHYNDKLYPEPLKWDPARFSEGRKEMEQEAHGFMGWGAGKHPCNGIRWAKIQQNMMLAYAFAMYKWTGCHPDGSPNSEFIPPTTALNELAPALPQNLFLKAEPRK